MRIAFFVNDIEHEEDGFTTTRLAFAAAAREHEVHYIDAERFSLDDAGLQAGTFRAPEGAADREAFLQRMRAEGSREWTAVDDFDILMLRNNPGDTGDRPWAHDTGLIFGGIAVSRGVLVVNDPGGAYKALNKMYLALVPPEIRPRTVITREEDEIHRFVEEEDGFAILKPLGGFGGQNVFVVRPEDGPNLNQMIEAVKRDGYVVVQQYLPAAEQGDVRLMLVNGYPLEVDGEYACFRRVPAGDDLRSNMTVGGEAEATQMDEQLRKVARVLRPTLVHDGMFFVGVDVVEDKILELNVFSPGGLGSPEKLTGIDFAPAVIQALERKVELAAQDPALTNLELATL
jgi:glutathione synthase